MDIQSNNTYVINGKTYTSLDDMPPEERAVFQAMPNVLADNNHNGMPDILENLTTVGNTMLSNTIVYEGKTYANVNDLPPEGRVKYAAAMSKLADTNQNGMPDVIENVLSNPQMFTNTVTTNAAPRVVVQQQGTSNIGPIVVLGIVAIGLAVVLLLLFGLLIGKGGL